MVGTKEKEFTFSQIHFNKQSLYSFRKIMFLVLSLLTLRRRVAIALRRRAAIVVLWFFYFMFVFIFFTGSIINIPVHPVRLSCTVYKITYFRSRFLAFSFVTQIHTAHSSSEYSQARRSEIFLDSNSWQSAKTLIRATQVKNAPLYKNAQHSLKM